MDIKYLSDAKGTITGVFIPLDEWQRLQKQYNIQEAGPAESGKQLRQQLTGALQNVKARRLGGLASNLSSMQSPVMPGFFVPYPLLRRRSAR